MNLMGTPVTRVTERAAPPRASPSILVITQAGQAYPLVEFLGRIHGVLSGHGVHDQQRFVGSGDGLGLFQFLHQLVINVEPSPGINEGPGMALFPRPFHSIPDHLGHG